MTEQGGSRAEGSIMPPPCAKCGRPWHTRTFNTTYFPDDCDGYEPMQGDDDAERQRESSRSDLLDGDDSGLHGVDRERAAQRAVELAVLAERMRGALANIRVYLTEMEQENDELRRAAAKWSEL